MKQLIGDMNEAMLAEYARAAAKYGANHASAHEAFAVMLEEVQESQGATQGIDIGLTRFWNATKANESSQEAAAEIREAALQAAAELVQVAAMAHKATLPYSGLDYAAGGAGSGQG